MQVFMGIRWVFTRCWRAQVPRAHSPSHSAFAVMKLLLIEDNATLAHWLARMLRDDNFTVDA